MTTPLFIGFWSLYSRLTSDERFKKEIKPLFQIRSRSILPLLSFGSVIVAGMVTNWLVSFIRYTIGFLTAGGSGSFPTFDWQVVNLANSLDFSLLFRAPILTIPIWVGFGLVFYQLVKNIMLFIVIIMVRSKEMIASLLNVNSKTYTKIPNRGKRFAGYGGVPVAHELKPGFDLSKFALKSKMICHFPRVDFENKTKENADEFVNDNDKWHIKKLLR